MPLKQNLLSVLSQEKFQERVLNRRTAEFDRRRVEREERINQIIQARKQEREVMRKKIYYVRCEDERLKKLHEEEEARKWEGKYIYKILTFLIDFIILIL